MKRGEVWEANLDPAMGHEQAGTRRVLILSEDRFNTSGLGLVTILPMTTKQRAFPTRIAVMPPEGGVTATSFIIGEQVRTIDSERLTRKTGTVTPATMSKTAEIVRTLLGL